MKAKISKKDTV